VIVVDSATLLPDRCDLLVVGAGPAGLAAAATAAGTGMSVILIDENAAPGGQIYRAVTTSPLRDGAALGADYWRGADIVRRFEGSAACYAPRSVVWSIAPESGGFAVGVSRDGRARLLSARRVVIATGALERPFPIPGWTLPGVMSAGAAQIALKSSGAVPDGRVVLAGSGPLLYLLASQLAAAGADIVRLLETTPRGQWRRALPALPDFLRSPLLAKGARLLSQTRRLPTMRGVDALRAEGDQRLRAVTAAAGGRAWTIPCDALLLHHGVIPNVNMAIATGCAHEWNATQRCWAPRLDDWLGSTVDGVGIAGDGGGVAGAEAAPLRGEIAALAAAHALGRIDAGERDRRAAPLRRALEQAMRGRDFIDRLYAPAAAFLAPADDDTIVCRCEEVTAGAVRKALTDLRASGPNQLKSFLRCGMGPCQGRLCGPTVTEMVAQARSVSPADVGYYRLRTPVKPITVGEIASLPQTEEAIRAVAR
jgi:NADPH-dependent 2,4-dienoyl-CoA reductase/sulfur reductase-like enzyme